MSSRLDWSFGGGTLRAIRWSTRSFGRLRLRRQSMGRGEGNVLAYVGRTYESSLFIASKHENIFLFLIFILYTKTCFSVRQRAQHYCIRFVGHFDPRVGYRQRPMSVHFDGSPVVDVWHAITWQYSRQRKRRLDDKGLGY